MSPTNPLRVTLPIFTVVAPDLATSIAFYRDVLFYDGVREGVLAGGRRFALLSFAARPGSTVIRLLEAKPGAAPNRPAGASIMAPGLVCMVGMTRDNDASQAALIAAGGRVLSAPQRYAVESVEPLSGLGAGDVAGDMRLSGYCGFGPSGEAFFRSADISVRGSAIPFVWDGLHSPLFLGCVATRDRGALWRFYEAVFGLLPSKRARVVEPGLNTLMGRPAEAAFSFGSLGKGFPFEWWDTPADEPADGCGPASLDRTGLAMMTLGVDDLPAVAARAAADSVEILSRSVLPTLSGNAVEGFVVRGSAGELIEVIANPPAG